MTSTSGAHKPKIVVASADIPSLMVTGKILRESGYEVRTVSNADQLMQSVKNFFPDLVIIDTELGGRDGYLCCEELRRNLFFENPVLFYSGETDENMVLDAFDVGGNDFLSKPSSPGMLKAKVKVLLQMVPYTDPDDTEVIQEGAMYLPAYDIQERIGSGASGAVFKAVHKVSGMTVAIKVLDRHLLNERDIQRFFRGSMIGMELPAHPNLVQVIEIQRVRNRIFQVMEYIEGRTLYEIMRTKPRLTQKETLCVLRDIGQALDHLHTHQVLHRDVKPGNIFVLKGWHCKLGDLGISRKIIDRAATTKGHVVGTPGYIAPEQIIDNEDLDIRGDLFSLGLSVYHAVTGTNPFARKTAYEAMVARLQGDDVVLTREDAPQIDIKLRRIITKLLHKKPSQRYATPRELLKALENIAE